MQTNKQIKPLLARREHVLKKGKTTDKCEEQACTCWVNDTGYTCQNTEFLRFSKRNQKRLSLDSDLLAFLPSLFPSFLPSLFSSIFIPLFLWKEWETVSLYSSVWPVTEFYTRMDSDSMQSSCRSLLSTKVKVWATTPGSIFLRSGSGKMMETVQLFWSHYISLPFQLYMAFLLLVLPSLHQSFCIPATFMQSLLFECELDLGNFS